MPAIDLASGTGSTTLVTTTATQRFWLDEITIVPSAAGRFELLSGATSLTGEINANPNQPYFFANLQAEAVGDDLVLSRIDAMAIGGTYRSRVK